MKDQFIPFQSIGLCFSGGGYRATFFSLGVISYLNRVNYKEKPLLNYVEALSSVSGGSLLAVAYAKAAQDKNFDFDCFYKEFYKTFEPGNDKLLENAVNKLEDPNVWAKHPYKKRSLINAFALAYADMPVFKGQFGMFRKNSSSGLIHVCFNATEFSFGKAFRFQNTGYFGNGNLRCAELNKISAKVELADVVASSSCFPIGFEPLVFPDDYIRDRKDSDYKAIKRLDNFSNGVGIMDGGIVDNQGIGSMVNISKLSQRNRPLDLIVVNDVGSSHMQPWQPEESKVSKKESIRKKANSLLKYFGIQNWYWGVVSVGILLLFINSLQFVQQQINSSLYIAGGILTGFGLCLLIIGVITNAIKSDAFKKIRSVFKENVPEPLISEIESFQKLDIGLVKRMLIERATSGAKMLNNVFLKQIRYLNYQLLYSSKSLENKRISSVIGDLNGEEKTFAKITAPGKQVKAVALTASKAPTTLWWSEEDVKVDRMDSLIACGQFTTCYNFMKYILELKDKGIETNEINELYKILQEDWTAFNKNPLFALAPAPKKNADNLLYVN